MSTTRSPESRALRDESDAAERLSTPTNETGSSDAIREAGRYGRRMAWLGVQREVLAGMLRSHGEDDLAERALPFDRRRVETHWRTRGPLRLFRTGDGVGREHGRYASAVPPQLMCLRAQGAICAGAVPSANLSSAQPTSGRTSMLPGIARCEFTRSRSNGLLQTPEPAAGGAIAFIPGKAERGPELWRPSAPWGSGLDCPSGRCCAVAA
jgi:hypothetical protein